MHSSNAIAGSVACFRPTAVCSTRGCNEIVQRGSRGGSVPRRVGVIFYLQGKVVADEDTDTDPAHVEPVQEGVGLHMHTTRNNPAAERKENGKGGRLGFVLAEFEFVGPV